MSKEDERARTGSLKLQKKTPRLSPASNIQVEERRTIDDVTIVLTQAFCPQGHNLIQPDNASFDGQPGIRLRIAFADQVGEVTLSPIHGDHRKEIQIARLPAPGVRLSVRCPVCDEELPLSGECASGDGGRLRMLFLTPRLDEGHAGLICDVWGCPYSKLVDEWELISEVILAEAEAEGRG